MLLVLSAVAAQILPGISLSGVRPADFAGAQNCGDGWLRWHVLAAAMGDGAAHDATVVRLTSDGPGRAGPCIDATFASVGAAVPTLPTGSLSFADIAASVLVLLLHCDTSRRGPPHV